MRVLKSSAKANVLVLGISTDKKTVTGKAPPNSSVDVLKNDAVVATVTANSLGVWSYSSPTANADTDVLKGRAPVTSKPVTVGKAPTATPAPSTPSSSVIKAQINAYSSSGGGNPAGLSDWNDLNSYVHYGPTPLALKDTSGNATGWSAAWVSQVDTGAGNSGPTGISGIPDTVSISNVFIDNANANAPSVRTTATLRFSGLDPTKLYTIETLSARAVTGNPRITIVTIGAVSTSVDALVNRQFQAIPNIAPSSGGTIDLVIMQGASTQYAYLNAATIAQQTGTSSGAGTGSGSGTTPAPATTFNALSISPNQATAGNYYSGTISNATAGSTISIANMTVSGTGTTRTVTGAAPSAKGKISATESMSGATSRTTTEILEVLDSFALLVATDTAPVAGVPIIGTYARNDAGSVSQFYNWLGKVPFGGYGEAHQDRGYGATNFTDANNKWLNSVKSVVPNSKWVGAGRHLDLAMPMIPFFGSMADAASGAYDETVRSQFRDMRTLLSPTQAYVFVRLGWEFNSPLYGAFGNFQPWGTGNDATAQGYYIQIFQRYVNIARAVAAETGTPFEFRFDWVMNPGSFPFAPCYPGDAFVNRIGMDMYPGLNDKNVYRAPKVVTPQAQTAMFNYFMGQQYGPNEAKAFADARGKPFIIPEFAIEWDNGQVYMDLMWNWMVSGSNPVASIGMWNESSLTLPQDNVRFGLSGVYGQTPEVPNTGACIRYRWNPAAYPSQPATPAGAMVNRLPTDLLTWGKSGGVSTALVSGVTGPDGTPVIKITPNDTTTNSIKRISSSGPCPRGVAATAIIQVQADPVGFALFNGPGGSQTGQYSINLATGAVTPYTDNNSETLTKLQSKPRAPVKKGDFWEIIIDDVTTGTLLSPLIHMQPSSGKEMAYTAAALTDGIRIAKCEIRTY